MKADHLCFQVLSFFNYMHSNLFYIMVHIILKILGYVELFQKEYKSGCSQMEFLVMDESTAGEIYKRKGAVDITSNEDWYHFILCNEAIYTPYLSRYGMEVKRQTTGDVVY